ncbi:MAG: Hsp70 family protein [Bacteroidia bacterium]|nr:Hsp70 family protein [Bacteroidia bacterium]
MENMINFGIDLGTTNSAIAKFNKGEVHVFTNPRDYGRSTLPSVVAYRKDKIFVGTQAQVYAEKDPKNVFSRFKRKMGTTESFKVPVLNQSKTPVELSTEVLKELKTFVQTGETLDSAVITIPASFDTIQSNATKEAGFRAGFKQVVLLQEPIAASLAYANKKRANLEGQWLVYDLGGGTFDVALVRIQDGEMKVLDHEGDNFLGGNDFDEEVVKQLIIPRLEEMGSFDDLLTKMTSASGKYNGKFLALRYLAEKAKIELSSQTSAEINVQITDEDENEIDEYVTITRSEFESIIKPSIDKTIEMVKKILVRQSLKPQDVSFVLMVGGSTYIPYVRKRVEEMLNIPVNTDIDPTTAVAIGAAYFAGTKPKSFETTEKKKPSSNGIRVRMAYQKTSKEKEEYFAARIEGNIDGLFYRITRQDGGFDTGLKPLTKQISEELPLVENAYNYFEFIVVDGQGNTIETDADLIGINSGYGIAGQPLPNDICLEVDDLETGGTKLELLFARNTVLPVRKTITKTLNRTLVKGSNDSYRLSVLEGSHLALPEANYNIGYMEIKGTQITRDISKGSDIQLTFEISESRDLTVSAYLVMGDQEFKEIFNPKQRDTPVEVLVEQVEELAQKLETEIEAAKQIEDYETAKNLQALKKQMTEIQEQSHKLSSDDITDNRYQLEDRKRKIAQEIDTVTKDKRITAAKAEYLEAKEKCQQIIQSIGNDFERKAFEEIIAREETFLSSKSPFKIKEATEEMHILMMQVLMRTPEFQINIFRNLVENQYVRMNDQQQASLLIEAGMRAIEEKNWNKLTEINQRLVSLLPRSMQDQVKKGKIGF